MRRAFLWTIGLGCLLVMVTVPWTAPMAFESRPPGSFLKWSFAPATATGDAEVGVYFGQVWDQADGQRPGTLVHQATVVAGSNPTIAVSPQIVVDGQALAARARALGEDGEVGPWSEWSERVLIGSAQVPPEPGPPGGIPDPPPPPDPEPEPDPEPPPDPPPPPDREPDPPEPDPEPPPAPNTQRICFGAAGLWWCGAVGPLEFMGDDPR